MDQSERRSWPIIVCAVLTAGLYVAVTGLLCGQTLPLPISPRTWALSGSTCFVLLSGAIALRFRHAAARLTLLGLIACWLGDYTACLLLAYSAWLPQGPEESTRWVASAEGSMS